MVLCVGFICKTWQARSIIGSGCTSLDGLVRDADNNRRFSGRIVCRPSPRATFGPDGKSINAVCQNQLIWKNQIDWWLV
jgi:hypothetical protein